MLVKLGSCKTICQIMVHFLFSQILLFTTHSYAGQLIPYRNLIAANPQSLKTKISNYRNKLLEQNAYFNNELQKMWRCEGYENFKGTPFIFRERLSIVIEKDISYQDIASALFASGLIKNQEPISIEDTPTYISSNQNFSLNLRLRFNDPSIFFKNNEVRLRKELHLLLSKGSETMRSWGAQGFDTQGYNMYGDARSKQKIGTVKVFKFASANSVDHFAYILLQYSEENKVIKAEVKLDQWHLYPVLYKAFHQNKILPAEYINPHSAEEVEAISAMKNRSLSKANLTTVTPTHLTEFLNSKDGILIVPDLHDEPVPLAFFLSHLQNSRVDWVAIEASSEAQSEFQEINKPNQQFEPQQKLSKIIENWSHHRKWDFQHLASNQDAQNYIINASEIEFVHSASAPISKKVVFMDAKTDFISGRSCGEDIKHVTRNLIWANNIPSSGRGIVLGGSWHIYHNASTNFQDFLAKKYPQRRLFLLEFND